jgi:hypothetical protein
VLVPQGMTMDSKKFETDETVKLNVVAGRKIYIKR